MNKDSFLYVVIFTFLAAFVFVFVISLADGATAERVARNQELVTAQAFLNAVGRPLRGADADLEAFSALFGGAGKKAPAETAAETKTAGTVFGGQSAAGEIVEAEIDGEKVLVKQFGGQGLWGTITGVLAVNADVTRIIGLDIISHSETPGLGGRIEEDWFKNQFRGEKIAEKGISVRKGEGGADSDSENAAVDGITGASLTSAAMEKIVNKEINALRERRNKEGAGK